MLAAQPSNCFQECLNSFTAMQLTSCSSISTATLNALQRIQLPAISKVCLRDRALKQTACWLRMLVSWSALADEHQQRAAGSEEQQHMYVLQLNAECTLQSNRCERHE
jgi:hypothetical protein